MKFTLLTWNLHGLPLVHRSSSDLAKTIAGRDADVILLQEAWTRALNRSIIAALPGYRHSYTPIRGRFFRSGGLLALVRASALTIDEAAFQPFFCQGPAWKIWELDGLGEKGFQRLDLTYKPTGEKLTLFNTHLQSFYDGHPYEQLRCQQIAQIDRVAASLPPDAAVMAAGDYNTTPDESINPARGLWTDLTVNAQPGHNTNGNVWIDYVFARKPSNRFTASVDVLDTIGLKLSDHNALFATIEIPASPLRSAAALVSVAAAMALQPHDRREFIFGAVLAAAGLLAGTGTQAA